MKIFIYSLIDTERVNVAISFSTFGLAFINDGSAFQFIILFILISINEPRKGMYD